MPNSEDIVRTPTGRKHIFMVNLEDYYQVATFRHFIQHDQWDRFDARIEKNTDAMLSLLEETDNKATFFTSGWVGKNHSHVLRRILQKGHEIACQGYHPQGIEDLSPDAFLEDVALSKETIEQASGSQVAGFRIGRGWIGPNDLWALEILKEAGYDFDSSICPMGRQFQGDPRRFKVHEKTTEHGSIWEIPISCANILGWGIPFSGGNYIRQFPNWPVREAAASWVEKREAPLVMYSHIWKIDDEQPSINEASWFQRIRHYRNLSIMQDRIRYFLSEYPFTSIAN